MARFRFEGHDEPPRRARRAVARRTLGPHGRTDVAVAALARRIHDVADESGLDCRESDDLADAAGVLAQWLVVRGEAGSALDTNVHCDEEDVYVRASIRSPLTEMVLPEQIAGLAPVLQSAADSFHIDIDDFVLVAVLQRSLHGRPQRAGV